MTIHSQFTLAQSPLAQPEAFVRLGQVRFTVLASRLLRLEFSQDELFEDRPSQLIWYRHQPVPVFEVRMADGGLDIETEHLHLSYRPEGGGFSEASLGITLKDTGARWTFGQRDTLNLGGTIRTLDMCPGPVPVPDGLLSRSGWSVVDDSTRPLFTDQGWLVPRQAREGDVDLYFFGYGHDYRQCLLDYRRLTGQVPLIPRWALGNWWSRYWAYTDQELLDLMGEFRTRDVPLSVCIIDMDWHLVDLGNGISGWTGYTWNRELCADPESFLNSLHKMGLKTSLNLHPADGVRAHEEGYEEMSLRLGRDPSTRQPIPFDIGDPAFAQAYFGVLHHPHEKAGVDFWWIDWQQGKECRIEGLDPLWWLNHLHAYDMTRDGLKRPFILSRWGGLGSHRYPIGFSGDTYVSWAALAFQPHMTATAANVAYGWWSHDIGGHMFGLEDRELYTRWVQFGVFSPILRLHSTNNQYHERRPWGYDAEVTEVAGAAMRLRHALIPYLYSMAWRDHRDGLTLIESMYHEFPERDEAYHCPQQYRFGTELIVAPFSGPADPDTQLSKQLVWLPDGDWYDFFSGRHYEGNGWHAVYGGLADIPVFARAGAIVPMDGQPSWGQPANPAVIELLIYAGVDNTFNLYEDDGDTTRYLSGEYAITEIKQKWHGDRITIAVTPIKAAPGIIPEDRAYRVKVIGIAPPDDFRVTRDGSELVCQSGYDRARNNFWVAIPAAVAAGAIELEVTVRRRQLQSRRERKEEACRSMLKAFKMASMTKLAISETLPDAMSDVSLLSRFRADCSPSQLRALAETITESGVHLVQHAREAELLVLWNNLDEPTASYNYSDQLEGVWDMSERFHHHQGPAPRFKAIEPRAKWLLQFSYGNWLAVNLVRPCAHGAEPVNLPATA
jgi:alpha-glucosidase (family GH31 glycosyl hydrolase)